MTESGKNVIVKRKNPLVKISIEIREKGTYIYARTIPTLFSGFPIETKNALICLWSENPSILVAAMMLVRRGSIVSPVIFVNKTLMELKERSNIPQKLQNSLKNLAKFYSAAIPVHIFSLSSLIIQIKKNIPQNHEFQIYIDFACMKILEIMIKQTREQSSYLFDGRKLHYKGLISSYPYSESKKNSVDYDIETLKLTPLFGISSELVQKCESQLYSTSKPFEMRKLEQQIIDVFSFNSEIIKSLNFKENRKNRKNGIISLKSNKIVSNRLELYEFYEISENKNLLHEIIKHHKVEYVSGRIFPSQI